MTPTPLVPQLWANCLLTQVPWHCDRALNIFQCLLTQVPWHCDRALNIFQCVDSVRAGSRGKLHWLYNWSASCPVATFTCVICLHILSLNSIQIQLLRPSLFLLSSYCSEHDHVPSTPCLFTGSSPQLLVSVPEDKGNIERKTFWYIDDIRSNTTAALKAIPQNQFQNCFEG